jgi:hypothetical protein
MISSLARVKSGHPAGGASTRLSYEVLDELSDEPDDELSEEPDDELSDQPEEVLSDQEPDGVVSAIGPASDHPLPDGLGRPWSTPRSLVEPLSDGHADPLGPRRPTGAPGDGSPSRCARSSRCGTTVSHSTTVTITLASSTGPTTISPGTPQTRTASASAKASSTTATVAIQPTSNVHSPLFHIASFISLDGRGSLRVAPHGRGLTCT